MKQQFFSLSGALLMATFLLLSCEKQESEIRPDTGETGYLQFRFDPKLHAEVQNTGGRTASVTTDTWEVIIYDENETEKVSYADYTDVPYTIPLAPGDYTVRVSSENDSVAFDNPYYKGTEAFTIVKDDSIEVTVTASLANVGVTVAYGTTVTEHFSDYRTTVTSTGGELVFEADESRSGYFIAGEDLTVLAELMTDAGDTAQITGIIAGTGSKDHYHITINYDLNEQGILSPLLIVVDTTRHDIPVEFNGGDDYIPTFARSFGGSGDDQARAIEPTSDGGYIMAGTSFSQDGDIVGSRKGYYDYWIVKVDALGRMEWEKSLGGSARDEANAIRQTPDGGYIVAGWTESIDGDITDPKGGDDYWVVKLDGSGNLVWQKSLGGSGKDHAQSIDLTPDGGYIIAGYTTSGDGDITHPKVHDDYWVVKLDGTGNLVWQKLLGGSHHDYATAVSTATDGGYIVAGYSHSTNGDITHPKGYNDYWVVKLDNTGNLVWQKSFGGSWHDYAFGVQPTPDGGYVVAGLSQSGDRDITNPKGNQSYWVVKLDGSGNLVWQKSLGGSGHDRAYSIQLTPDGGYVVAGGTWSNNKDITDPKGNQDYWVVKLSASGNLVWQKSLGGSADDEARSVQPTPDGGYIVAGWTVSTDGNVNQPNGDKDYWVVKLNADGELY